MKTVRVFVAHPKAGSDEELIRIREFVYHTLLEASASSPSPVKIEVVLGRDDFEENFKRCGSWDAWTQDVVDRIDYVTRKVVYDAIVVTSRFVGKATAQIVSRAVNLRRTTLILHEDGVLRGVQGVRLAHPNDFKAGWEVFPWR